MKVTRRIQRRLRDPLTLDALAEGVMTAFEAWVVLVVARVERAKVESVDGVADEVHHVPFGQPVLQRFGQQQHLLRFVRKVVRGHASINELRLTSADTNLPFCRPDSHMVAVVVEGEAME